MDSKRYCTVLEPEGGALPRSSSCIVRGVSYDDGREGSWA